MKTFFKLLALALCTTAAIPAHAVSFYVADGGGLGDTARQKSIKVATDYWSSVLKDDVTVNLGFFNLRTGGYGFAYSTVSIVLVEDIYEGLGADQTTSLDSLAVASLQPLQKDTFSFGTESYDSIAVLTNDLNDKKNGYVDETLRIDNDGSGNNTVMVATKANAQAMGITNYDGSVIDDTQIDGEIYYVTGLKYDYDPTDGIDEGAYDFTGITIQLIAQVLGLDGGVWAYDTNTVPGQKSNTMSLENSIFSKPIDLFRYSDEDVLDWSTSETDKYFSIDGGETQFNGESQYHTGGFNGDGGSPNYWKEGENGELGIMQNNLQTGTGMAVSGLDIAALDAIGWDASFDVLANSDYRMSTADIYRAMTAVPEPSTWLQMILGFGLIGGAARYRRPTARRTA